MAIAYTTYNVTACDLVQATVVQFVYVEYMSSWQWIDADTGASQLTTSINRPTENRKKLSRCHWILMSFLNCQRMAIFLKHLIVERIE